MADSFLVKLEFDEAAFDNAFHSPQGMVGLDLGKRARRVARAAKRQVGRDTGLLASLITTRVQRTSALGLHASIGVWAGPGPGRALWHHNGTRAHIITPNRAEHLRFPGRGGGMVYVRRVNHPGTPANRYLTDNLIHAVR